MPAGPREFDITYGGFTVGGAARPIDGRLQIEDSFRRFAVEFSFVISKTTAADFATEVATVEAAFRKPRQDLVITINGQVQYNLGQSGNLGFDFQPRILKSGDPKDTGLSRRYTVRIEGGRPANNWDTTNNGRRDTVVAVSLSPGRRKTVTISGEWTAIPGSDARANYEAKISAYSNSVLNALFGSYNLAEEFFDLDDIDPGSPSQGKVVRFSRVYEEQSFEEAGIAIGGTQGSAGDAQITRQDLRISRARVAPGDFRGANRLIVLSVQYECWIDRSVLTGIAALKSKWEGTIRPWLVAKAREVLGGGALAVTSEAPAFDPVENRIQVQMTIEGAGSSPILERQLSAVDSKDFGVRLVPIWTGDPLDRYVFKGQETIRRVITEVTRIVGGTPRKPFDEPEEPFPRPVEGLDRERLQVQTTQTPRRLGLNGEVLDVVDIVQTLTLEFFKRVAGGAEQPGGDPTIVVGIPRAPGV